MAGRVTEILDGFQPSVSSRLTSRALAQLVDASASLDGDELRILVSGAGSRIGLLEACGQFSERRRAEGGGQVLRKSSAHCARALLALLAHPRAGPHVVRAVAALPAVELRKARMDWHMRSDTAGTYALELTDRLWRAARPASVAQLAEGDPTLQHLLRLPDMRARYLRWKGVEAHTPALSVEPPQSASVAPRSAARPRASSGRASVDADSEDGSELHDSEEYEDDVADASGGLSLDLLSLPRPIDADGVHHSLQPRGHLAIQRAGRRYGFPVTSSWMMQRCWGAAHSAYVVRSPVPPALVFG